MKFTKEQLLMISYLQGNLDFVVRAGRWGYDIGRSIESTVAATKAGSYWIYVEPMWPYSSETIKALIRKGVLIAELSSKEFKVQVALGTMKYRIYKLAEKYR